MHLGCNEHSAMRALDELCKVAFVVGICSATIFYLDTETIQQLMLRPWHVYASIAITLSVFVSMADRVLVPAVIAFLYVAVTCFIALLVCSALVVVGVYVTGPLNARIEIEWRTLRFLDAIAYSLGMALTDRCHIPIPTQSWFSTWH